MKLVSFRRTHQDGDGADETWKPGALLDGDRVIPLTGERSVRQILTDGEAALSRIEKSLDRETFLPLSEVILGPPVPDPDKIICIGLNYREHAGEVDMEMPAAPILFPKFRNSLVGDGADIVMPDLTSKGDYEGEMAVVIGRRCKGVSEEDALGVVAGYMPFNDVSARDLQMQTSQWAAGKALDTFAPCGPALVTADEIGDVQDLNLRTRLNGEEVQSSNTSLMLFPVRTLIAFISSLMTLEPGDVIATGTPSGVGFTREPPLVLKPGDRVEVEIDSVGLLSNPVVAG